MSVSQSADEAPAPGTPQRRLTLPAIIAIILASIAVIAGAVWGPLVLSVASSLRPVTASPNAVPPQYEIDSARQQLWTIVIFSFIALAVLAMIAVYVGRWAFPPTPVTRLQREIWAFRSLIGGLLLGLLPVLLGSARVQIPYMNVLTLSLPLAGAVGGFILSGIALPSAEDSVRLPRELRPKGPASPRFVIVISTIVALLAAFLIAAIAQVIVGFFLHFV